jgi:hypothetical protein
MHLDRFGVLQYRIRKLEIVLEIVRDAEAAASLYVKANLIRGVMERLLEDEIADASVPGLALLVARHHAQDLKFLRRAEQSAPSPETGIILQHNIAETIKLKEQCEAAGATLAATMSPDEPARRLYEELKKAPNLELRAKAFYSPETFAAFYADYSALSQFVHGGNRETLMVTSVRGDLTPVLLPLANQQIVHLRRFTEQRLAILRSQPQPDALPAKVAPIGYDSELEFRRITPENWLQPDMPGYYPGLRAGAWVASILAPKLEKHVPREINRLFEAARGAMVYSWFFYPLATLAAEQNHRVMEAALRHRCAQIGRPTKVFAEGIKILESAGVIPTAEVVRWQATRGLRNSGSHPERQQIWDPGSAVDIFRSSADMINRLFQATAS